jgi:DNA-binding SARP family transcriptional activator
VAFPTRKTLALMVYLAIEGGMQPRAYLATLFWPNSNPERSYANLRNTLGHLQKVLKQVNDQALINFLVITHNALGLNPDADIDFDLHTVARAYDLARADRSSRSLPKSSASLPLLQSAVVCQRGDFLAGFSLGDAPSFDDWVAIQREVWHRRLNLILDRLSEIQFARGEFAGVTETTSRWIALDALNEVAYRRKMRAHFAAGERGQGLETYQSCQTILSTELGIEPEPDTEALADRIRTQTSPSLTSNLPSAPRPRYTDTSVAFLGNLFVGRNRELQMLEKSFEQAVTGKPQLVVLRGEPGIGKTYLAKKFLAGVKKQRIELLQGSAFESGSHLPFQPLIDALRLRLDYENSPKDLLHEMWLSPLGQMLPELATDYSNLATVSMDWNNLLENSHPEIGINQTFLYEPVVRYSLELAKQAPLILFMDDLQWADSATLDLLHYAIRRWQENATRVLLFIGIRSEALHPMIKPQHAVSPVSMSQWLARVTRELTPFHIELEPLDELETVKLIQSILMPPAPDFAQWLYKETRGQPFYLIETLKDLLERRVLHPKRRAVKQWVFALDAEHDLGKAVQVPSTVYTVIRARLNRLSPNALNMLVSGAVLEHQITFELMCIISNLAKDLALPALDELISGRILLEADQPGVASTYPFVNDMLRDVVYTEAGDARRRLFHQRALEVLDAAKESPAVLAHHAQAAGLAQAAFHHSLAAGRGALHLSAVSESIVHFERARQFVRDELTPYAATDAELQDLYLLLGKAYEVGGQIEKAIAMDDEWAG